MKIHNVEQGTPEWKRLRAGIPTASCWHKIVTPAKLQPSKSQTDYMYTLLAERYIGEPIDEANSGFMQRGREFEPAMFAAYNEYLYGIGSDDTATKVGFVTSDDGRVGVSPDRLVGERGYAEGKVPAAHTHMKYLCEPDALREEYIGQVQWGLWVTERDWADLVSWHPTIPIVVVRIERDEDYIGKLSKEVREFCHRLEAKWTMVQSKHGEMIDLLAAYTDLDPFALED